MQQVLQIAVGVATPLALLGLVSALVYGAYLRRLKHREAVIGQLPEAERARAADDDLTRYGLDVRNLSAKQKIQLLSEELARRHSRARLIIVVSASVFI